MSYKISLTLEVHNRERRDELLAAIRRMLIDQRGVNGKVKVSHQADVRDGLPLDLAALGVDADDDTPIERAIGGFTVLR